MQGTSFAGMEYFGSRPETPREVSLSEVDRSDIYVGIFAHRYGTGITADEYHRAMKLKLPCLIYLKDDSVPVLLAYIERDPEAAKKLEGLKQELKRNHTISVFKTPEDLATKVVTDLHNLLVTMSRSLPEGPAQPTQEYRVSLTHAQNLAIGDNALAVNIVVNAPSSTPSISREELLDAIHHASGELRNYRNTIAGIHIERSEVTEIVDWILNSDPSEQVGMLLDQPGCGKTVVMRGVLERLEAQGVPTLAIKADTPSGVKTPADLTSWLRLPADPDVCGRRLAQGGLFVLLLDQLDALSLSLTRDQAALNVTLGVLARLRGCAGIRIVCSCRSFDRHFDPQLSAMEAQRRFELRPLEDSAVDSVLSVLGASSARLLPAHRALLKVPLNLDVYARVVEGNPQLLAGEGFRSLQDMYEALWQRYVTANQPGAPPTLQRSAAIYRLVDEMYRLRQVAAPVAVLDEYAEAATYLEHCGFIRRERGNWLFLHQTLFDYCFARRFVAGKGTLTSTILDGPQGLFERAQLLQALAYPRGTDEKRYVRELAGLLLSDRLRVHLRLLLVGWLGSLRDPTEEELAIAIRFMKDAQRRAQFLGGAAGNPAWFDLLGSDFLPRHMRTNNGEPVTSAVNYLAAAISVRTDRVLELLEPHLGKPAWDGAAAICLSHLEQWHSPKALYMVCTLFARGASAGREDLCLHHLARSNPAAGCRALRAHLDHRLDSLLAQREEALAGRPGDPESEPEMSHSRAYWERHLLGRNAVAELVPRAAQDAPEALIQELLPWLLRAIAATADPGSPGLKRYRADDLFGWGWHEEHASQSVAFIRNVVQAQPPSFIGSCIGVITGSSPACVLSLRLSSGPRTTPVGRPEHALPAWLPSSRAKPAPWRNGH
jgi:hypothetical protein